MLKDVKWVCIFLITVTILGCNNRKFKEYSEETISVPKGQIQEEIGKEEEVVKTSHVKQQIDIEKKNNIKSKQEEKPFKEKISPLTQEKSSGIDIKEIKWYKSFNEGLKVAKEEKKILMVDFEANWCIWCKKLDETTYNAPQVIALSKKFIPVKVNCEEDTVTPSRYGVNGLPTIIFMNFEGQVIHQIVGYREPDDFVVEMKKVLNE